MPDVSKPKIVELVEVELVDTANGLLEAGWVLLQTTVNPNGWPKYILGRPEGIEEDVICTACGGTKEIVETIEGQKGTQLAPCPRCVERW